MSWNGKYVAGYTSVAYTLSTVQIPPDLQSAGVSASSNKNLFWRRIRAKQLSLHAPDGSLGRSRISLPSTIRSQLLCNSTSWSGGDNASWYTRRLPSAVSRRNLLFHCLKINPPGGKKQGGKNSKWCWLGEMMLGA